jgi:hypothetical protein
LDTRTLSHKVPYKGYSQQGSGTLGLKEVKCHGCNRKDLDSAVMTTQAESRLVMDIS